MYVGALALAACTFSDIDLTGKRCPCGETKWRCNTWTMTCAPVRQRAPFALRVPSELELPRNRTTVLDVSLDGPVDDRVTIRVGALPDGASITPNGLVLSPAERSASLSLRMSADAPLTTTTLSLSATTDTVMEALGTEVSLRVVGSPGTLDETFGDGGVRLLPVEHGASIFDGVRHSSALLFAGVMLESSAHPQRCFVAKLSLEDGGLEPSFGASGISAISLTTRCYASRLAVDAHQRILLAGFTRELDGILVRWQSDGTLDEAFGTGGIAMMPNSLATSESPSPFTGWRDLALATGGAVFTIGSPFLVGKYSSTGALDTTFADHGLLRLGNRGALHALAGLPDGSAIVGGFVETPGEVHPTDVLLRLMPTGALDPHFGLGGTIATPGGTARLARDALGRILRVSELQLARYSEAGVVDTSLQVDPLSTSIDRTRSLYPSDPSWLYPDRELRPVFTRDGKILIGGPGGFARFLPDGRRDTGFGVDGVVTLTLPNAPIIAPRGLGALAVDDAGKILTIETVNRQLKISRYWP